jgi:leucyl/phenylalanyl-tRNA--protein transferase
MSNRTKFIITPDILLRAYAAGIFPMADNATSTDLRWFDPPIRAVIPLDSHFHVPRRLKRTIRQRPYKVKLNTAFGNVIRACAQPRAKESETWINQEIIQLYTELYKMDRAHSVEVWDGNELIGGLYGVSLGSAFFGESMFSTRTDTSKIALVHLVALIRHCGFTLLDTQFQTEHLTRFGTTEITRANYHHFLEEALKRPAHVISLDPDIWHTLACQA